MHGPCGVKRVERFSRSPHEHARRLGGLAPRGRATYQRPMNRRQRRKNALGEFVQFGFSVDGSFVSDGLRDTEPFCDALIAFVESRGLSYGGSIDAFGMEGFVERWRRNERGRWSTVTSTDADRALVGRWLCARQEIASVAVGPLRVIR